MTRSEFTAHKLANMDYAVTDRRLTRLDFLVLWIFTSAADWRTGSGRRQQTEVAKLLGCTRRAVRRCLDRLVACNYLDPVGPKPGKYISAYNILGAKRGPCVLWFKLPIRISYRISERR